MCDSHLNWIKKKVDSSCNKYGLRAGIKTIQMYLFKLLLNRRQPIQFSQIFNFPVFFLIHFAVQAFVAPSVARIRSNGSIEMKLSSNYAESIIQFTSADLTAQKPDSTEYTQHWSYSAWSPLIRPSSHRISTISMLKWSKESQTPSYYDCFYSQFASLQWQGAHHSFPSNGKFNTQSSQLHWKPKWIDDCEAIACEYVFENSACPLHSLQPTNFKRSTLQIVLASAVDYTRTSFK